MGLVSELLRQPALPQDSLELFRGQVGGRWHAGMLACWHAGLLACASGAACGARGARTRAPLAARRPHQPPHALAPTHTPTPTTPTTPRC